MRETNLPIPIADLDRQVFLRNRAVQLLIDPADGLVVDANPAACEFYGYSREALVGRPISEINTLSPTEIARAMELAATERQGAFSFQHRLSTGEVRDVEVHSGPVDIGGRKLLCSIVHDVTERRRAEAALQRTISLLESTFESTADGLLVVDLSGRIISHNSRFADMWRIPPAVLASRDDASAIRFVLEQLVDPVAFTGKVEELYAKPREQSFDVLTFKDGRVFERYSLPQILSGEPAGRVWSFRDITDKRHAEAQLRAREADFRVLFANHPQPMWVYDLQGLQFLEVNEAAVEHYGYSRREFMAMRITDIRPPGEVPRLMASVGATRKDREHSGEWRHRKRNGSIIDVSVISHVLEFAGRRAALVEAQDVTDKNRALDALRESEEKYRAILEGIDEGYYEVGLDGRFTFLNDAICRSLGYTRDELLGSNVGRFTSAADARRLDDALRTVMATSRPAKYVTFTLEVKDGAPRHMECSMSVAKDRDGVPVGVRGVVIDVTDRQHAEEALRESEERYRKLVELSPDAVAIHSEGRVVFTNTAGLRMMGGTEMEQVMGLPAITFVHPDSRPLVAERMRELHAGKPVPFTIEKFQRLDGRTLDVEVAAFPFTYHDKPAVQVVIRDISERKRAEALQAALYRIAQTSSTVADMPAFYADIHAIVGELMYARNFYIALHDPDTDGLSFAYFVDEVDREPPVVKPGKTLTEFVLRTGHPLLVSPGIFGELSARGEVESVGSPSVDWLGVPLKRGDEAFGVLVVQSYTESVRFTETDRDLLTFVAQHVAAALDRKRGTDALMASEERFRTLAETAPSAIFIYQGATFRYVNAAAASITGYSREELTNRITFWELVHPGFRDIVRQRGLARQRGEAVPSRYEFKILKKDGEERWIDFSAGAIESDGRPAALGIAFDITERKRAEEQIKSLAYHDVLTGLPNRLLFNDRLSLAVAQAHRLEHRLGILFLDVDRFKVINDSLGHTLGDRLLQGVAERLQECVREGDTVARLGGDEFILLLPGVARGEDAAKVAEKLLESLKRPFHLESRDLFVTASIGISLYPDDGKDGETLVKNADTAMYRAKEQGRDNYKLYTHAMNERAMEHLALESSLRRALVNDELVLHYQPLLDLESGRVHGLEALVRWNHPERGLIYPGEFIPLAEVTSLIVPMGPWILRTACAQARQWQEQGHGDLSIAVNLSARQFQQPDLLQQVKFALEESGLPARYLDLEITETHAMQNAEATILTLRELKALGVRISIDDFGIGYSSLSYLKRLPIDTLKIDQSFVRDITTDPDDAAIATAVIALAHTLKLRVVAEGVETEEQLAFLAERHCDRMQGYLFSKPLPVTECTAFLQKARG